MEVDNARTLPILKMRYPVEDGVKYQEKIQARKKRLREVLDISVEQALEIVGKEFAHLMATQSTSTLRRDPGNSAIILEQYGCTDLDFIEESKQRDAEEEISSDTQTTYLAVHL